MKRSLACGIFALMVAGSQAFGMAQKVESVADKIKVAFSVVKQGRGADLKITVSNTSRSKVELAFQTGNTNDFLIKDRSGKVVWQWTKDRLFKEKPLKVQIEPGRSVAYAAKWDLTDLDGKDVAAGTYRATGILQVLPTAISAGTKTIEVLDEDLKIAGGYIITGRIAASGDKVIVNSDDGTSYILANDANIFRKLAGKYIRVFAPVIESIPGSNDKKMTADNYKVFDERPVE